MRKVGGFVGVDLFCGCGGVTRGFLDAGIKVKLGVDLEPAFKATYKKNNQAEYLSGDIRKLTGAEVLSRIGLTGLESLVISSCSPCQPFSLKNAKRTVSDKVDPRADLGFELVRIIGEMRGLGVSPAALFLENVPEFGKSPIWAQIRKDLFRLGFSVVQKVINCAEYGVPQSRRRFIAVALDGWSFVSFPAPTHGPGSLPFVTVRDAFQGLPSIDAGEECKKTPNHRARDLTEINLARIKSVPLDGGSRASFPPELVLDCHRDFDGHKDVYGRMKLDEPSPTITTRCVSITNGRYGHPVENRGISLREAARLQSFPDNFVFEGASLDFNARMIGNAVPVRVARIFGEHLMRQFDQTLPQKRSYCAPVSPKNPNAIPKNIVRGELANDE